MNFFEPILILIVAVNLTTGQGLVLTKNKVKSCLGEGVVFTCTATEGSTLKSDTRYQYRWIILYFLLPLL